MCTAYQILFFSLNLKVLFFTVIPPPLNVQAIQFSPYAPVEVSWSPPTHRGAFSITGYRLFYGHGETAYVSAPTAATSIGLRVEGGGLYYDHQIVFIHSESDHLSSELVNVTVGKLPWSLTINTEIDTD